jgi:hypothetical protein
MTSPPPMSGSLPTPTNLNLTISQAVTANPPVSSPSSISSMQPMKSPYQADQQVKFLHLQAEIESLLIQLQSLKQHKPEQEPLVENNVVEVKREPVGAGR